MKKKCFIFKIFGFLCFDESTNFKISDVTIGIFANRSYTFDWFFRILGSIKIKFGQIIVQLMANISNLLHYEDWKLVPSPFMILMKTFARSMRDLLVDIRH